LSRGLVRSEGGAKKEKSVGGDNGEGGGGIACNNKRAYHKLVPKCAKVALLHPCATIKHFVFILAAYGSKSFQYSGGFFYYRVFFNTAVRLQSCESLHRLTGPLQQLYYGELGNSHGSLYQAKL
jgi:hypothetical protein